MRFEPRKGRALSAEILLDMQLRLKSNAASPKFPTNLYFIRSKVVEEKRTCICDFLSARQMRITRRAHKSGGVTHVLGCCDPS